MYNAGIKKTVPIIRFPHTPHHKIRPQAIATSIPGPLQRLPHHRLPGAVVPGRPAEQLEAMKILSAHPALLQVTTTTPGYRYY